MKKKLFLRLCLIMAAMLSLYSCHNENFANQEANSQRNAADFFKHSKNSDPNAKSGVDYIAILEAYNEEHNFLAAMPDQKGTPIWEKMRVMDSKNATGLIIPLSYDNETLSSVLYATLDDNNTVTGVKDYDNGLLEKIIYDSKIDKYFRQGILTSYLVTDHYTFDTTEYTNIPTDLFTGIKHGNDSIRLSFNGYVKGESHTDVEQKLMISTTCLNIYHCKNGKTPSTCDGCSLCVTKTCGTEYIFSDDDGFPTTNPGNTGGGGGTPPIPQPPKDPCTLSVQAFYRLKPGCGGGSELPILDDPCVKIAGLFANPKFKDKYDKLTKKTPLPENVFNLDRELAVYMRYPTVGTSTDPAFVDIDMSACATDGDIPTFEEGMGGLIHTHNNETCNGGTPIKVPSPIDIKTFINILLRESMQYTGSYANAYSLVTTSEGNYMLMYEGNNYPGSLNNSNNEFTNLDNEYRKEFQKLYDKLDNVTQTDLEKLFTKFMKEKLNRPGIKVYRVTSNSAIKLEYDPTAPNSIKETTCP